MPRQLGETAVDCPHCDGIKSDAEMVSAINWQLDLRREPENEESANLCTSHRVRHLIDSCIHHRSRIAELEEQLWLIAGDVEAMHRSHAPGPGEPPITRDEIYHLERAKALLAGYEPKE